MSKTIKITEDKFKRVLREVFKEEIQEDNFRPFEEQAKEKEFERNGTPYEGVEDGHGESTVGHGPDYLDKNEGLNDIVNI
jgi:hypothetical protein